MNIGWPRTSIGWWRFCLAGAATAFSLAIILQPPPWKVFAGAGDNMRPVDWLIVYSWVAAAINIVVLAALALLCPWWACAPKVVPAPNANLRRLTPRWFWPAILAAMVMCSALTVPRLTQSLWDDEELSLRLSVLGRYKHAEPNGHPVLKEVRWRDTIFFNAPNNHVLHNALARLSNSAWRLLAKPAGLQFKEWALRLPAFFGGLGTLVCVALLLADLDMPLAGALAAWALALHPWFEKYSAEARGYSMAMFFVCAALLFWRRAMMSGGWLWWALFALAQTLCLWTWPGALFFFVIVNLGTIAVVVRGHHTAFPERTQLSRWFCCNALAAVALAQLMLPLVPQVRSYFAEAPQTDNGLRQLADAACYLAAGSPWIADQKQTAERPEIRALAGTATWQFAAALAAGSVLFGWGVASIARAGKGPALVMIFATAGASMLQVLEVEEAHMFVFAWYVVYLLPLFAGALAAGLAALGILLWRLPSGKVAAPAAVLAVFALFLFVTQPARARGLARSTEPVRESVLLTRPDLDFASARNSNIMTVGITDPPFCYDPNLFWARSTRDLLLLCLQADAQQRPLWLNIGHRWLVRANAPLTQEIIDDPSFFNERRILLSEFPHCDRMVCHYVPGSATRADLSRFLSAEDVRHVRENAGISPERYFAN